MSYKTFEQNAIKSKDCLNIFIIICEFCQRFHWQQKRHGHEYGYGYGYRDEHWVTSYEVCPFSRPSPTSPLPI